MSLAKYNKRTNSITLDEPTASLDPETGDFVRVFRRLSKKKKKLNFTTSHNMNEVERLCTSVL